MNHQQFAERRARLLPMILEYNERGYPRVKIANELGISAFLVGRILKDAGVELKYLGYWAIDPITVALYYNMGLTSAETAERMGASANGVNRIRKQLSIPMNINHSAEFAAKLPRARQLADEGCSASEIARTLKMSQRVVSREFPESNWTYRQGNEFRAALVQIARRAEYNKDEVKYLASLH